MLKEKVTIESGLTYGDWLERIARLEKVKDLTGEKILYARSKNLMKLRHFKKANSAEARIPLTEDFKKFQKEVNALRNKYVITGPQGPIIDIQNPSYIADLQALQEKFKDAIEERERDSEAYNDFLMEVVRAEDEIEVHTSINDATKELTQEQVDAIWWFVEERKEEANTPSE